MITPSPVPLSLATLGALPAAVQVPAYDRASLSPGIVHVGPGNFHRAHQAVYLDALMRDGLAHDWGIVGASIMSGDARLREMLLAQDCLGTVVSQSPAGNRARITGCQLDYLPVGDIETILQAMADPATRIVSLTVTEGGYYLDATTGHVDLSHPALVADATAALPATTFGILAHALARRRAAGVPAFTIMSCDNLPHNGRVAREATVGTARLIDAGLADWIDTHARFPNAMVDRITPATGERERRLVREEHGIDDPVPVFCETFIQWVLEDDFALGRPPFERAGVQIVDDVTPFETMKIRVLNGGHALLAYPAALLDIEYVDTAMQHPLIGTWLKKVEADEVLPTLQPVPDTDTAIYLDTIIERFANPAIGDTVQRLAFDGSNRQPKFIVPTLADRLAADASIDGLAMGSAFWCRYCAGTSESGKPFAENDGASARLRTAALQAREDPSIWLAMHEVYGSLAEDERLQKAFAAALRAIWRDGTQAVLSHHLDN